MSSEIQEEQPVVIKQGPPWKNVGVFQTYEAANELRTNLVDQKPDHQFKVKRLSSGFTVKSRLHPDHMPKKENKKNGKNRKSRKGDSKRGEA